MGSVAPHERMRDIHTRTDPHTRTQTRTRTHTHAHTHTHTITQIRNVTDALLEPLTTNAAAIKKKVDDVRSERGGEGKKESRGWRWRAADTTSSPHPLTPLKLYTSVKTPPDVAAAAASYKNESVSPKLMAAQVLADVAKTKKARADAKLGTDPFCKAVDQCANPALTALAVSVNLISDYLTYNVDNMGPNPTLEQIAAANNASQAPINDNTSGNVLYNCVQKDVTSYTTGHTRILPNGSIFELDVYTEWISVGLADGGASVCDKVDSEGPTCAVVCARRGMACDPCAMKSATVDLNTFGWAATQAGDSELYKACKTYVDTTNAPGLTKGAGTGYWGYVCDGSADSLVLYSCNLPDYDKLKTQNERYSDACQVPTYRKGRDLFPDIQFVGAQTGALCYCTGSSIVPPN